MAFEPILWALKDAPVVDAAERLVLIGLAERAWEDGCDAFPSVITLADAAKVDPRTVQRRLRALADRKLIRRGDQSAAQYIPADERPVVYDLLIPLSWFPNLDRVQEARARQGRPPLLAEDRPDLPEPPPGAGRKRRSDAGVAKPPVGVTTSRPGLPVTPDYQSPPTTSRPRGDYESPGGVSTSHPTHPPTETNPVTPRDVTRSAPDVSARADISHGGDSTQQPAIPGLPPPPSHTRAASAAAKGGTPRRREQTQIPSDFELTEGMAAWARKNTPDVDPVVETKRFIRYFQAKGTRWKDWAMTWRNWMLKEQEDRTSPATQPARNGATRHLDGDAARVDLAGAFG